MSKLLQRWIYLPEDSVETKETKRKLVMLIAIVFVIFLMSIADILGDELTAVRVAPTVLYGFAAVTMFVWMFGVKTVSYRFIGFLTVIFCLTTILGDLWRLSLGGTSLYAQFVIVLDFLLILRTPHSYSQAVVALMVVWLVASGTEDAYRWGLYDLPSLASQQLRREDLTPACEQLPCAKNAQTVFVSYGVRMIVVFSDYWFTRDFATRLFAEQAARDRSVDAVRDIARHISRFNLSCAHKRLAASDGSLPPDLVISLRNILNNLEGYRRYLPRSCLQQGDDEGSEPADPSDSWPDNRMSVQSDTKGSVVDDDVELGPLTPRGLKRLGAPRWSMGVALRFSTVSILRITAACDRLTANAAVLACRLSRLVESALHAVECRKGIIDLLEGDAMFVSFNAARSCTRHCVHAIDTSAALSTGHTSRELEIDGSSNSAPGADSTPVLAYEPSLASSGRVVSPTRSHRAPPDGGSAARLSPTARRGPPGSKAAPSVVPPPPWGVERWGSNPHQTSPQEYPAKQRGAAERASQVDGLAVYFAVASGRALCGDVGCADMQRFGVIGQPSAMSSTLAWLGRSWDISIVCDVAVQREVMHFHDAAMLPRMVCVPDSETPAAVYEVLPNERTGDGNPEEWMYELRGVGAWDGYNDAVESFLKGDRSAAERWAASAGAQASGRTGAYFARFKQFMAAHGAPPPPVDPRPMLAHRSEQSPQAVAS
ncbi:hypothetical protein DIPPA_00503 [Diplonema papillatum]|nr:hypothetical protein DIPPA_00503 [Diplonema papillatum]